MITDANHARAHAGLAQLRERIDRRWQKSYVYAQSHHLRGARRYADRSTRTLRAQEYAAWRGHVVAIHRAAPGQFEPLSVLERRHARLHSGEDPVAQPGTST